MFSYIEKIASLMSEADKNEYKRIFEPRVVAVPPADSRRDVCVCADGEIRAYGARDKKVPFIDESGVRTYIASRDGGLSWKEYVADPDDIGACVKIPWTGRYITIKGRIEDDQYGARGKGSRYFSDIGPGDTDPEVALIPDIKISLDNFQPYCDVVSRKIFCPAYHIDMNGGYHLKMLVSEDDGVSFKCIEFPEIPRFEMKWPHKSIRWENNGAEPSVTRLKNGPLWMIIRTSHDYMYESFSYDNGETWSAPAPSRFHLTLTTPYPLTLSDGRTILFWNNTQPLPEFDKDEYLPPIENGTKLGFGEDVFTNRDVSHCAITEDGGKSFIGCRELIRSPIRNSVYYRAVGDEYSSNDKSVHQFQAIELPYGKVLVSVGQNTASRKLVIFDVNWLYEKECRETFRKGLENVTTHGFIRGYCESHKNEGPGHCQWNRVSTVYPMPDPAGGARREVQQFVYNDDPRLISGLSGMTWNYPASDTGHIELEVYRAKAGLRISLCDMWINPTDDTAYHFAKFTFEANESVLPEKKWVTLCLDFDVKKGLLEYSIDGNKLGESKLQSEAPIGLSYLHLQTLARERDFEGSFIRELKKL
ncbi:MAG: exo-alpha-sialidase [Clostridia bacterium]|nr:exo-alpha-sialidase [Clostridia bacterium]